MPWLSVRLSQRPCVEPVARAVEGHRYSVQQQSPDFRIGLDDLIRCL